jgi:hypothetical protein
MLKGEKFRFKVFCVGLNKTGTTSLGRALEHLGARHLGWSSADGPRLIRVWAEDYLDILFKIAYKYDVIEDFPWPLMYKELDEHFQNAKFVLTRRSSPEIWFNSYLGHVKSRWYGNKLIYGFAHPLDDPDAHMAFYQRHNASVREHFAGRPDKLLEVCWEEGSGWKEVCSFLEIDKLPRQPFPHANRRAG